VLPSDDDYLQESQLPVISNDAINFALEFNNRVLTSENEFEMHVSLPGQNYDLMMALTLTTGDCFIVFMDMKSAAIREDDCDIRQYNRVVTAVDALQAMANEVELSAASEALVAGRFAFIYVTTHAQHINTNKNKVYFMSEREVKALFGVTWDLYKCSRGDTVKF
jgi:hypothetical protein